MERKKVYSHEKDFESVVQSLSKTSKWRAYKNGWVYVNYHERKIDINIQKINLILFYKIAKSIIKKIRFKELKSFTNDDFIQEIVTRFLEISNLIPIEKDERNIVNFLFKVGLNTYKAKHRTLRMRENWKVT